MNGDHPQDAEKRRYTLDRAHSGEKLDDSCNLISNSFRIPETYSEALSIDGLIFSVSSSRARGRGLILFSFLLRLGLGPGFTVFFRSVSAALFVLTSSFPRRSRNLSPCPIITVIFSSDRNTAFVRYPAYSRPDCLVSCIVIFSINTNRLLV